MKHVTFFSNDEGGQSASRDKRQHTDNLLDFDDADIRLNRRFLEPSEATNLLQKLLAEVAWQQDTISLFGKTHLLPRLHQWYGDAGTFYAWSGIQMRPRPWFPVLTQLRQATESHTNTQFNCVLLNLYRDGNDSMGWHADDETMLGEQPVIASISLGAERDLLLRRHHSNTRSQRISLNHGSLLIMAGTTQSNWQHALPRRKNISGPRINLTFRYIRTEVVAEQEK